MKISNWLISGALALPLIATTAIADDKTPPDTHQQQNVTIDQLPAPVKATVQKEIKGKTLARMAKTQQNGQTVYEIDVAANGKTQEIDISDAGKVVDRRDAKDTKDKMDTDTPKTDTTRPDSYPNK